MRVLVIDDDHLVRRSFVRSLGRRFDVMAVASIEDALTVLADPKARFDAILCDLELPTKKTVVELVAEAPNGQGKRVILVSGALVGLASPAMEAVRGRFVPKVAGVKALFAAIDELVAEEGELHAKRE